MAARTGTKLPVAHELWLIAREVSRTAWGLHFSLGEGDGGRLEPVPAGVRAQG